MLSLTSLAPHIHKLKFLVNENSTVILTGAGVVGTVGTAILTGRASFKAAQIIENEKEDQRNALEFPDKEEIRPFSKTEKVKMVWVHFLPPVAAGAATVTCIVLAHRISSKKIANGS